MIKAVCFTVTIEHCGWKQPREIRMFMDARLLELKTLGKIEYIVEEAMPLIELSMTAALEEAGYQVSFIQEVGDGV